jgi:magnesium-transporting ATPase (P-type)
MLFVTRCTVQDDRLRNFAIGLLIGAAISLFVFFAWPALYAHSLWPGYSQPPHNQAHEYNSAPAARNHVFLIFLVTGAVVGLMARSARGVVFAWLGLSAALLLSFVIRPEAWSSNLAPLALILYPVQASLFLLTGLGGHVVSSLIGRRVA